MAEIKQEIQPVKVPEGLFKDLKYYLIGNIDEKIVNLLNEGGAKRDYYLSEMVTYAIADDCHHDEYSEAKELFEIPVVTPNWVIMSVKCGRLLGTEAFSPDDAQLFSGMVACPSQLSMADQKHIWALLTYHGASCQLKLNKKCTHLITSKTTGSKYERGMQHCGNLKIVTPDWVMECVDRKEHIPEERYHPRLLIIEKPKPQPPPQPVFHTQLSEDAELQKQMASLGVPPPDLLSNQSAAVLNPISGTAFPDVNTAQLIKSESLRTKEMLARMVSNRIQGKSPDPSTGMRPHSAPTSPRASHSGPNSPRGMGGGHHSGPSSPRTLRNITNNTEPIRTQQQHRSPSQKVSQLVSSLNRQAPHASPGRGNPSGTAPSTQPPTYFGHDTSETVPPDICLLGCVFYITDYQKYLEPSQIDTWKKVIEQHGGQVDDSYSNRVTHLLCDTQSSDVFLLALRDQRRVVTAHWLNDCLLKKKMTPPWLALHFPTVYGKDKPCKNQIISITGFENEERTRMKHMISVLGARYTGYMTHANSVLICKKPEGVKYNKALEWQIPTVNVQWLNDLLLGHLQALKLPVNPKYRQFNLEKAFNVDMRSVSNLMDGWRTPVRISKDAWKKFGSSQRLMALNNNLTENENKRKASSDVENPLSKKVKISPTTCVNQSIGKIGPAVLFTGLPRKQQVELSQMVEKLGGCVVTHGSECTHLVATQVARTMKFLTGFSVCKHLVNPEWVIHSYREFRFLDETPFTLTDTKAEERFCYNLMEAISKSRTEPLFKDLTFYLTPSLDPPPAVMQEIIECAGGTVAKRRLSAKGINSRRTSKGLPGYIVLSCENDLHLCRDIIAHKGAVYNVEFVLIGIVRQHVDYDLFKIAPSC